MSVDKNRDKGAGCRLVSPEGCEIFIFLSLLVVLRFIALKPSFKDGSVVVIRNERVLSEPLRFDRVQRITVLNLKVYLPLYPEVEYGDVVTVRGRVNLKKKMLEDAEVISLQKGGRFFVIRQKIISFFQKSMSQPYSSLVSGIVLGSKEGIQPSFWEKLKRTGTAHVVVASGMNVSLLGSFLVSFLVSFIKRRKALVISIFGIWVYAVLAGFDAPIVRAAIMGSFAFGAVILGRESDSLRILFLTFFIMLVFNPYYIFDIGFILSFSATLSILLFAARLEKFLIFTPHFIRQDLATTIAAQILVSPILYFTFGYISIYSFLVNGLVLWTVPLITVFGLVISFLSLFVLPLAKILAFLIYPLAFWFIRVVELFA